MPTTPLQRLLFAQGGDCFFCRRKLGKAEASVEHLIALTHGGKDNDENCVACCKTLNNLFGRMSLKEKLQVVLNQRGNFVCPGATGTLPAPPSAAARRSLSKHERTHEERFDLVVTDLHKRGNARPATVEKLLNTIRCQMVGLGEPVGEADTVLGELRARDYVRVEGTKVLYFLPEVGKA